MTRIEYKDHAITTNNINSKYQKRRKPFWATIYDNSIEWTVHETAYKKTEAEAIAQAKAIIDNRVRKG